MAENYIRDDLFGFTNRIPIFLTGIYVGEKLGRNDSLYLWKKKEIWSAVLLGIFGLQLSYETNYLFMDLIVPTPNCCIPNFCMTLSIVVLLPQFLKFLEDKRICVVSTILKFFGKFTLPLYCVQEVTMNEIMSIPKFSSLRVRYKDCILIISIVAVALVLHVCERQFWMIVDFIKNKIVRIKEITS